MTTQNDPDRPVTLFETAANLIRHNIDEGLLRPGLVLQESGLAERLGMSRATVKRALEMIESEGLIHRFSGRGFLVAGGDGTPQRDDLRLLELDLAALDESAASRTGCASMTMSPITSPAARSLAAIASSRP